MRNALLLAVMATLSAVSFSEGALAQAASGTVTTNLTIEGSCVMGTDAVVFTNTVSNSVTSDWTDSGNLTFACSASHRYIIRGNRVAANGSVELSTANSSEVVSYSIDLNDVAVPNETAVQVMAGATAGLSTFINIPVDIVVAASDINDADPDTYSNVVNVEVFLF